MKRTIIAGVAAAGLGFLASETDAATFPGFQDIGPVFFDDEATFDYDPAILGGSVTDPDFLVSIEFSTDLSSGSLTLFDDFFATVLDGTLLDTALSIDNGTSDDTFFMLFSLTTGATPFAVATFTGDLDNAGTSDFLTDGVVFANGSLTVTGAVVIPLPASIMFLGSGLVGLGLFRRRRKTGPQLSHPA